MISLPIDPSLPRIVESLEKAPNLVLKAAPGSGKTTRVPPALLKARFGDVQGEIIVLEPRRLAAKYSARRVAQEMGEEIGKTVGYQFRFENVGSASTRLRFLTEGMLMRRLLSDPLLSKVRAVILDEFHERHLHTDTALAYLRHLQKTKRPELRIVVMSATLDSDRVSQFLEQAPVIEVSNRPYPVTVHYRPTSSTNPKPLELQVRDAVVNAIETDEGDPEDLGDVLVFLPGMGEIRRAESALLDYYRGEKNAPRIFPLHGELSREEQDQALVRSTQRKIILSTNVAETSLTIEGVTQVIDSGLHRMATYSWWSGVPSLKTRAISRASAIQRAGRAGRTAPGRCFRLYSEGDFESRPPFETPEIQRADLTQTLLELKTMGLASRSELDGLEWFEPPSPTSIEASEKLLFRLGAIDASGALTSIGARLARFPAHPRIARFLLEASRQDCLEDAATLAAWISEGRLERLDAVDCLKLPMSEPQRKLRSQMLSAARDAKIQAQPLSTLTSEARLRFSLLTGFPDRVSKRRKAAASSNRAQSGETELVFSSGGSARIEESATVLASEYFVTLDLRETQHLGQARSKLQISSLTPIEMDWLLELSPSALEDREHYTWDNARERVMQASQLTYDELILEETTKPAEAGAPSAKILIKAALAVDPMNLDKLRVADWIQAFSKISEPEKIESAFARALLLKKHYPKLAETFDPDRLSVLLQAFENKTSLSEARSADWGFEILSLLVPDALAQLDRLLPEFISLPSGRKSRIHYALDKAPWVESRLQDFFGMKTGPALIDGRLPLTLHLLAPNQRAVQVTTDLAGFWQRGYQEQRNALSRRYPRHSWPEDPLKPEPKAKN